MKELQCILQKTKEQILAIKQGIWRHFKGGRYLVLGVGYHSETKEEFVVYKALDGQEIGKIYVRPVAMFEDYIDREGYRGSRFVLVQGV